jgi:thiol-disulfide isomerase/thioredoxin
MGIIFTSGIPKDIRRWLAFMLIKGEGMKRIVTYFCSMAVVLLIFACDSGAEKSEGVAGRLSGDGSRTASASMVPHFALPSALDGTIIDSDEYQGRVRLINFFATWCPPCLEEIPNLIDLEDRFGNDGLSVIGLSVDQGGREKVKKFVNKMKINYPVLMADEKVSSAFGGVSGIPVSFIVARDGTLIRRYLGYVDHAVLERDINELLQP